MTLKFYYNSNLCITVRPAMRFMCVFDSIMGESASSWATQLHFKCVLMYIRLPWCVNDFEIRCGSGNSIKMFAIYVFIGVISDNPAV